MPGSRKEKVTIQTSPEEVETEASESRDVYLREGRTLSITEQSGGDLVEIRSASGLVELRIKLTEEGPVLQMEAARLQLKATESVEIESKRVEIRATETVAMRSAGTLEVTAATDLLIEAQGETCVKGQPIELNPVDDVVKR
jgi:hypothetical protein